MNHYLKLSVNVRLVNQTVEHIKNRVNIPDLWGLLQHFNLRFTLFPQLGPELGEGLELVDELVYDLPQPLVWKFHRHGCLSTWKGR